MPIQFYVHIYIYEHEQSFSAVLPGTISHQYLVPCPRDCILGGLCEDYHLRVICGLCKDEAPVLDTTLSPPLGLRIMFGL